MALASLVRWLRPPCAVDVLPIPVNALRVTSGLSLTDASVQYLNDSSSVSAAWNLIQPLTNRSDIATLEIGLSSTGQTDTDGNVNVAPFSAIAVGATAFTFAEVSLPTSALLYVWWCCGLLRLRGCRLCIRLARLSSI